MSRGGARFARSDREQRALRRNRPSTAERSVSTSEAGEFHLPRVPKYPWRMRPTAAGFRHQTGSGRGRKALPPVARHNVTAPRSSGWRGTSSTRWENSGSPSRSRMPPSAIDTAPLAVTCRAVSPGMRLHRLRIPVSHSRQAVPFRSRSPFLSSEGLSCCVLRGVVPNPRARLVERAQAPREAHMQPVVDVVLRPVSGLSPVLE